MFFRREYVFKGKHAQYVKELSAAIFSRYVDVLILAPIIGLVYNRKTSKDNSVEAFADVPGGTIVKEKEKLLFNYRLCMLFDDENDDQEKIDNAFRYYTVSENDSEEQLKRFEKNIEIYNSYILGGVEVLYELLLKENHEFNGNVNDSTYKRKVISDVTEFVADYTEQVKEINSINDELEI